MSPNLDELNLEQMSIDDKKECNILTLGATGSGKSTWINSIANYCKYKSFNEALKHKPNVLIPALVTYSIGEDYEKETILVKPDGEIKSTEQFGNSAMSSTQSTQVYSFQDDGITYNIIDVPGVGDTRGVQYDKVNMKDILDTVNKFKSINMVCVLMKSTETRLDDSHVYCLNELLIHLVTRNSVNNISFVFTNARNSEYRPGDAMTVMKDYVKSLKETSDITIPLTRDNIFCVDSEAFKCQCIYSQDPKAVEGDILNFENSWKNSLEATKKLLKRAREIKTVSTREIINVNEARAVVTSMIKPLASITALIQASVSNCLDMMKKDMMVNEYDIFLTRLKEPRMVCASSNCIGKDDPGDPFTTYYKTICHDQCYLTGTNIATFPEERLKKCVYMTDKGYCKKCSCSWDEHMHILYDQRSVKKEKCKINEELKELSNSVDKARKIGEYKEELEREQRIINESVAKFIVYLRHNAIMKYNDAYKSYLNIEITNAKANMNNEVDNKKTQKKIEQLEKLLKEFSNIQKFIDDKYSENSSNDNNAMTPLDINKVMKDLFNLRLYGEKIREIFNVMSLSCFEGKTDFIEVEVKHSLNN